MDRRVDNVARHGTTHRPRVLHLPHPATSSITVEDSVSNEHVLERVEALARTVLEGNERVEELLAKMSEGDGGPQ